MGFDIKDLAGLSEPAKKLVEVVSEGIGTLFRPHATRRDADAKAYEIRALAAADADANATRVRGHTRMELERISTLAAADPELLERAKLRLLSREIEGQINVETIAEHALKHLPAAVSHQPVTENWRRKFFQEAENICDQDLQLLWGKVLAGEVTSPGSYSLRTLEILKHLSKGEAELFRQACSLACTDGWIILPGSDINYVLKPYGITYNHLLSLREAGLIYEGDTLIKDCSALTDPTTTIVFSNNGLFMQLSGPTLRSQRVPSLPYTRAGQELQNLIEPNPCMPYLRAVAAYFGQRGLTVKKGTSRKIDANQTLTSFDEEF